MVLSKLAVKWLEWVIEIGMWLTLIGAFIGGFTAGEGFFGSLIGAILATVTAGVFAALVFGGFVVLIDVQKNVRKIAAAKAGAE